MVRFSLRATGLQPKQQTNKSRHTVVKYFQCQIRTSFYSLRVPLRYRVLISRFSEGLIGVPVFWFFIGSCQGPTRVQGSWFSGILKGSGFPVFVGSHQSPWSRFSNFLGSRKGPARVPGAEFLVCPLFLHNNTYYTYPITSF